MAKKSKTNSREPEVMRPSTMAPKQVALRFFTYGAMTLATIIGAVICVGWAMGYRFSPTGKLSQIALLQFKSFPSGAKIEVNKEILTATTPARYNVGAGAVQLHYSLSGYRSWSKNINIQSGEVRWMDYVRLIPVNIDTDSVGNFSEIDDILPSPDRKWAIMVEGKESQNLKLIDLTDPKKPRYTDLEIDKKQITEATDSKAVNYKLIEWDSDSRYVLLERHYDDKIEHLSYDRNNKTTRNITKDFAMDFTNPHFSGTSGEVLFAQTGGDLRKIDYNNKSLSTPLASNVTYYQLYSNSRIAFTTKTKSDNKTKQTVAIYDDGKVSTIKEYDDNIKTLIAFSRTNDVDYLSVARGEVATIIPDPLKRQSGKIDSTSTNPIYLNAPGKIDWLVMSYNGRFVLAGHNGKVVSYDIETDSNYAFQLSNDKEPTWLDDFHLLDIDDNSVTIMDFDGSNPEHIVSGHLPAFLSADGKYLFSVGSVSGGDTLQRSTMVVK